MRPVLEPSDPDQPTVQLLVTGVRTDESFFEEVPVEPLGGERYRLLASPGLLDGLAAGDVFDRHPDGRYDVVEHGGNVCVQVYFAEHDPGERVEGVLVPEVTALGGWLDGRTPGVAVFTIPVSAGFAAIEGVLEGWIGDEPHARWSYANVYGPDGDQLRWWEAS